LGYGGITLASSKSPLLAPESIFLKLKVPVPNSAKIREDDADEGEDVEAEGEISQEGRSITRGSVRIPPLHRTRLADVAPYLGFGDQASIEDVPVEEVEVKISPRTTDLTTRRNKKRTQRFEGFFAKTPERGVAEAEEHL
jgi:hypothetical protein